MSLEIKNIEQLDDSELRYAIAMAEGYANTQQPPETVEVPDHPSWDPLTDEALAKSIQEPYAVEIDAYLSRRFGNGWQAALGDESTKRWRWLAFVAITIGYQFPIKH